MHDEAGKFTQLRQRAQERLDLAAQIPIPATQSVDELLHELQVHQIELEIQLEDLQHAYLDLEQAHQSYQDLFDFAPVGYVVMDLQGFVTNVNRTLASMLGIDQQSVDRKPFADFITPDFQDAYHLCRRDALNFRHTAICEVELQRSDNTRFYAQLTVHLPEVTPLAFRIAVTDVSIAREMNESLRHALESEREISQLRNRTLLTISHEFRTPLAVILAQMETLQKFSDRLTAEKKQQRFDSIRNQVSYLNNSVENASSLYSIDGQPRLSLETFDAIAAIRTVTADVCLVAGEGREIDLKIVAEHASELVDWDVHLLRRIILNLLNNALRYSSAVVCFSVECTDTVIRMSVEDHGIGISEEDQKHIFEAFYRGSNVGPRKGTGLGLFVVQRAVQAHGGSLRCESRLGEGTTFVVELPRKVLPQTDGLVATFH